jgi:hypothetical protein
MYIALINCFCIGKLSDGLYLESISTKLVLPELIGEPYLQFSKRMYIHAKNLTGKVRFFFKKKKKERKKKRKRKRKLKVGCFMIWLELIGGCIEYHARYPHYSITRC